MFYSHFSSDNKKCKQLTEMLVYIYEYIGEIIKK